MSANPPPKRSVLWNFKFLSISLLGSLAAALVATFAPPTAQIAFLGACVSILAGLFVAYVEQEAVRDEHRSQLLRNLQVPIALAPEHDLFDHYQILAQALIELSRQVDPVLRQFALLKLASLSEQASTLARGKIVFSSTETWRTIYEQLLQSAGLQEYRSAAWVKTKDYWQDQPGVQSMRLNYHLLSRGLRIERIVILRGDLWAKGARLPGDEILPWIEEQHRHGVVLSLVREEELRNEPDLLVDFGIYDERATGIQELDEQARTVRFILEFDRASLQLARDRWTRLALYARPYEEILEATSPPSENDSVE